VGRYLEVDPLGIAGVLARRGVTVGGAAVRALTPAPIMPTKYLANMFVGALSQAVDVYSYVNDNPLRYKERLGLDRFDICEDVAGPIGSACRACVETACKFAPAWCCKVDYDGCIGESGGDPEKLNVCWAKYIACGAQMRTPRAPDPPRDAF
jgi:hypothetical protein